MDLYGQSILVTGAAGGLGVCFVKSFLKLNAKCVVAIDVDDERLKRLEKIVSDPRLITKTLDIGDETAVLSLFREVNEKEINPKILINNAGVLCDGLLAAKQEGFTRKLSTANWAQSLSTNLTGHFFMTREFAVSNLNYPTSMAETGSPQTEAVIVNISSISSVGTVGQSNYAAAKAGLDASTRTWARELASDNIRVCGVAPGFIITEMVAGVDAEEREKILNEIPLGRPGQAEDVWIAVKFAIECDYFTGRVVSVDGGSRF